MNSLYPYFMFKNMPGGNMFNSTDPDIDNYFGVVYCTVQVPDNIYNPLLVYKYYKGNSFNATGT